VSGGRVRRAHKNLVTAMAAVAVTMAPATGTLLAAPGAVRVRPAVGTAAWRSDSRHLPDPVSADPVAVQHFLAAAGTAEQRQLPAVYPLGVS
jgi:hypothetical protein